MALDRQLEELKKKYGRRVANAFADAISDVKSRVVLARLVEALDRGDIDAALDLLNITPNMFANLRQEVAAFYNEAGQAVMSAIVATAPRATKAVLRWDAADPVAEDYLRNVLGQHITRIADDTRGAVRVALSEGFARGQGPRQIALDVVGRIGPNGRRTGGVLGLNGPQEQWVSNMRTYLRNGELDKVLRMSKRDRRFDRTIMRLMEEGKQPTAKQIEQWTGRYSDRLLKLRGDTIARTETATAQERSRVDAHREALGQAGLPDDYTVKKWFHGGGGMRPRETHVAENEDVVRGLNTPFTLISGVQIQHPHDPNAPAEEVINCTCTYTIRIDWRRARKDGLI
jgi:hypothetical protein